jgi:hypothetical protein
MPCGFVGARAVSSAAPDAILEIGDQLRSLVG